MDRLWTGGTCPNFPYIYHNIIYIWTSGQVYIVMGYGIRIFAVTENIRGVDMLIIYPM